MNLYLLIAAEMVPYDGFFGHVIAARDAGEARQIANNAAADEGTIWESPKTAKCAQIGTYTGPRRLPHIVLSDFNAG